MTYYVPGTGEEDLKKIIMSLQQAHGNVANLQTAGTGLVNSGGSLAVSLSSITASLGGDVALNNTSNYFDGPSIAQGASGTWFVSGSVTVRDTSAAATIHCKLWDGTTVVASCSVRPSAANELEMAHLSGIITNPAGNLRISCRDIGTANGVILASFSGNLKDSTISAVRIA